MLPLEASLPWLPPPPRNSLQQIHPAHHLVLPGLQATSQPEGLCIGLCVCTLCWVWLFATPWTVACQAPLSMRFPQAKILEWVAISFSRASFRTGIKTTSLASPALACIFFTSWATGEALELLCLLIYPSPLLLEYPLHRSCLPCSLLPFQGALRTEGDQQKFSKVRITWTSGSICGSDCIGSTNLAWCKNPVTIQISLTIWNQPSYQFLWTWSPAYPREDMFVHK